MSFFRSACVPRRALAQSTLCCKATSAESKSFLSLPFPCFPAPPLAGTLLVPPLSVSLVNSVHLLLAAVFPRLPDPARRALATSLFGGRELRLVQARPTPRNLALRLNAVALAAELLGACARARMRVPMRTGTASSSALTGGTTASPAGPPPVMMPSPTTPSTPSPSATSPAAAPSVFASPAAAAATTTSASPSGSASPAVAAASGGSDDAVEWAQQLATVVRHALAGDALPSQGGAALGGTAVTSGIGGGAEGVAGGASGGSGGSSGGEAAEDEEMRPRPDPDASLRRCAALGMGWLAAVSAEPDAPGEMVQQLLCVAVRIPDGLGREWRGRMERVCKNAGGQSQGRTIGERNHDIFCLPHRSPWVAAGPHSSGTC